MIDVLARSDSFSEAKLFQSMHADRKRVFVDMLKWDIPHDGVFEQDQYDTVRSACFRPRAGISCAMSSPSCATARFRWARGSWKSPAWWFRPACAVVSG